MEFLPLLKKKNVNIRNPNIDFLRVLGMFSIVVDHIIFHGRAMIKYSNYKEIKLLYIFSMWHVSSFGIVSGLVGNKTHKYSNLLYLWIIVVFYSIIFYLKYNDLIETSSYQLLLGNIFPVINNKYWYFTSYFGMYPFLCYINSGNASLSQLEIKKSIYFMFGIFILWASLNKDSFAQHNGKSPFSLLIFYIIGAYIDKYIFYRQKTTYIKNLICLFCILVFIIISLITYIINTKQLYSKFCLNMKNIFKIEINSFPMIMQAYSLSIFICHIKLRKYISKFMTLIGPLTFDIYLIHENTYIRRKYIKNSFDNYPINLKKSYIIFLIYKRSIFIFVICIFIAYIRNIIFQITKVKFLCRNLEIIITRIINYLI